MPYVLDFKITYNAEVSATPHFFFYISVLPADSLILLQQAGISHKIYSLNCGTHEGHKENNEFKQSRSKTYPAGSG